MTNEQRDELLISMAKGLNNLQCAFNDFRVEIRAELNSKVDALDQKFTNKFDSIDKKVSVLEKDNVQIKSDIKELIQRTTTLEKDNTQIKSDIKELAKNQAEFRKETKINIEAASDIIRDIYKTNYETSQHLKRHDILIQELHSKLA